MEELFFDIDERGFNPDDYQVAARWGAVTNSKEKERKKMELKERMMKLEEKIISKEGKFTVLGIDKFDGTDWVEGRYDSKEKALEIARKKTREAMPLSTDQSIATVYYAYSPEGKYLGGDVWNEE